MRSTSKSITLKHISFLAIVLILISCFISCTAGSCLSYGHSCWGAHGKRNGFARALLNPDRPVVVAAPSIHDDRWARLVSRQLMQSPLAVRMRAKWLAEEEPQFFLPQVLDENDLVLPLKRSVAMETLSRDFEGRGIPKNDKRATGGESSDPLFNSQSKDSGGQAIKMRLYKILNNIDDKSK